MKDGELLYNKQNFSLLKQEREELNQKLSASQKENKELKNKINDLKVTLKSNKELLKTYANQIYEKEQIFDKLNNTIDDLKTQIIDLEKQVKKNEIDSIRNCVTSKINTIFNDNYNEKDTNENISDKMLIKKQDVMMEDLFKIKDNLQFLIDFFGKINIRKDLNKSINLSENLDESFYEGNNNEGGEINNEDEFDNSFISENIREKEKNNNDNVIFKFDKNYNINENFTKFIEDSNLEDNLILFVDGKDNIWEIIKRNDLNLNQVKKFSENFKKLEEEFGN